MLPGRTEEYKYLDNAYKRDYSQIIVLYGKEGVGKSSLIKDFCKDKRFVYFLTENVSQDTLLRLLAMQVMAADNTYEAILSAIEDIEEEHIVFSIDEFHNFVKNSPEFMNMMIKLIHESKKQILLVLMSSDTDFVENDMISRIGALAYEISGFLKIRELTFLDMVRRFPKMSVSRCIETYAILGGVPGLWRYFSQTLTLKENICRTILKKGTVLYNQAENEIALALREAEVYNTILFELANGHDKLNDIYNATGYSRAKISVYLKNLMEKEIVIKLSSIDTPGRDNSRKGIYRISNNLVFFYFRFIFAHKSELFTLSPEGFYDRYIEPSLEEYTACHFAQICSEYVGLLSQAGKAGLNITDRGAFYGKSGNIDIVAFDKDNGKTLIGMTKYGKEDFLYSDYEALMITARLAKVEPDFIYLFSSRRFDGELTLLANSRKNISLVDLSML